MLAHNEVVNKPNRNVVNMAYLIGASDGESGSLCLPELFFVGREYQLSYVRGFEDAAGETLLSKQVKELHEVK